jgi:hypothetical protein
MREPTPTSNPWIELLLACRWPLVLIAFLFVGWKMYLEPFKRASQVGQALTGSAEAAAERAEVIARAFYTGNITEKFLSAIPEIASEGSGLLEVAKSEVVETFSRSDERRVLWDALSLGTTELEVKVPVTYRYHLRFDSRWRIEVTGSTCLVYAPRIQPTQPPAIHTEGLERRVDEGWLRFDSDEQLASLESSMTPRLRQLAGDPRHIALVRDTARRTVADFVRGWLLREEQWRQDHLTQIKVVFADETVEEIVSMDVTIELIEEKPGP